MDWTAIAGAGPQISRIATAKQTDGELAGSVRSRPRRPVRTSAATASAAISQKVPGSRVTPPGTATNGDIAPVIATASAAMANAASGDAALRGTAVLMRPPRVSATAISTP